MASKNQPAFTLRDGAIKCTCWCNESSEGDNTFHSVDVVRSYKDAKDEWQDTRQFSGSDILKASALMQEAYAKIREIRSPEVTAA